jgi:hypothetical protein
MPIKKSGGAQAVERKHRERNAKRPRGYAAAVAGEARALWTEDASPVGALLESIAELRVLARQAATDPGMPPEYRREQAGRLRAALVKAADPARLLREQDAELRAALALIESLQEKLRAARAAQRSSGGTPATDIQ